MIAHQTAARNGVPNTARSLAVFGNQNVSECFVDIDGLRYAKDSVTKDYASSDSLAQHRDPNFFYREGVGE